MHRPTTTGLVDPRAQALASELAADAIRNHGLRATSVPRPVRRFGAGVDAELAASVAPIVPSAVVRISDDPGLLDEARHLEQLAGDKRLPAMLRRAFPAVYAITSEPSRTPWSPLCGYLMEDFSTTHEMLSARLLRRTQLKDATVIANAIWAFLERVYTETLSDGRPDFERLYVEPSKAALAVAAQLDPRLGPSRRIVLRRNGCEFRLPPWAEAIERMRQALDAHATVFRTYGHGELHPWNILLPIDGDINPGGVRLLGPQPRVDDFFHDMGRLIIGLRYAHLVDRSVPVAPPRISESGDTTTIEYGAAHPPAPQHMAAWAIGDNVLRFARSHGDPHATTRLKLAIGAARLGVLPQLDGADEQWRHIALGAFAEGLREVCDATGDATQVTRHR